MEKLRIGLIGANRDLRGGGLWYTHQFPEDLCTITAVADWDPAVRAKVLTDFPGTTVTSDWHELLKMPQVDAVGIFVRDAFHEEIAVAALEAGKTVYLEKPMAITIEGCDHILDTAQRTGTKLYVGHNMRFMPFVQKMKEVIDSGVIGQVQCVWVRHFVSYGSCYFRHWCAQQKNCTGLLLQKGAHDIDVIHWLAGSYTRRVSAMGRLSVYNRTTDRLAPGEKPNRTVSFTDACWPPLELKGLDPALDVEDSNMVMMQLENGVQAVYLQCMYAPDTERNYTFIGDHGRVENLGDCGDAKIMVWTTREPVTKPDIVYELKGSSNGHGGADEKILRNFVQYALGREPALTNPIASRNAVAAGVMGHASARHGSLPYDVPVRHE